MIPIRDQPSHKSQMVSQLVFGERYEVLEDQRDWMLIRGLHDNYEGWINSGQHNYLERDMDLPVKLNSQMFLGIDTEEFSFPVTIGSYVPNGEWNINGKKYLCVEFTESPVGDIITKLELYAHLVLNSPYVWGGRTPLGFDCSGLTQIICRLLGKNLKRDAWMQSEEGTLINFIHESKPGDLAFFDNEDGAITHVGIILPNQKILHSSGCVRIDSIDHEGIYRPAEKKYTHKLRIIKRHF